MKNKKYRVSRATLYNTIELLLKCSLVRKHQFTQDNQASYEKCYFNKQHDHLILIDSGEVIEFCDPRIETIKKTPTIPKCVGANNRPRIIVCINNKIVEKPCSMYNQKLPISTFFLSEISVFRKDII